MAGEIPVIGQIVPKGGANFPPVPDSSIGRGFRAVDDIAARDALTEEVAPEGSFTYAIAENVLARRASGGSWVVVDLEGGGGGGGGELPDITGEDGKALFVAGGIVVWRFITSDDIRDFAIGSFGVTGGGTKEVGESVVTPAFTATYSPVAAVLTRADLDDDEGSPTKSVLGSPTSFASDGTFSKVVNNESVQFTLSADDDAANTDTRNLSLVWRPRVFTGITAKASGYDEADIEALAAQSLRANANISTNLSPVLQYIVHAYPVPYGPKASSDFQIGDLGPGDMSEVEVVSITNAFGVTQDYQIARSDFLLNAPGGVNFSVS